MRFLKIFAAATAAFAATAAPVLAEGGHAPAPQPPVVIASDTHDWSGAYAGGAVGFNYSVELLEAPAGAVIVGSPPELDGVALGVFAGYLHQIGDIVVGGELGLRMYDTSSAAPFPTTASITETYARARAGYAFDRLLASGFIGLINHDVDFTDGLGSGSVSLDGHTFGLGLDYAITDSFVVGGEYVRSITIQDFPAGEFRRGHDMFQLRASFHF